MAEDDCEIEYLDEDEEVVQQCVQNVQQVPEPQINLDDDDFENHITPLLVERKPSGKPESKRKIKTEEEDSDYNPSEDLEFLKEIPRKRKRTNVRKTSKPAVQTVKSQQKPVSKPVKSVQSVSKIQTRNYQPQSIPRVVQQKTNVKQLAVNDAWSRKDKSPADSYKIDAKGRKKLDIRMPDYEDPLCLPVRAIIKEKTDLKRLKQWNNFCLEHFQKSDSSLALASGPITSSTRTFVLRNVKNMKTGTLNTLVSGKISVKNLRGEKKTETLQSMLPEFHERKMPSLYKLRPPVKKEFKNTFEVILTKETQKDGDILVTYSPKEAIAAVYKLFGDTNSNDNSSQCEDSEDKKMKYIREMTCCKICPPCYQVSWRGIRKNDKKATIKCAVCSRSSVSVYNLLAHLRAHHKPREVRQKANALSDALAKVVEYHYKCRICPQKFANIKLLRKHIVTHRVQEVFKCEVCNQIAS